MLLHVSGTNEQCAHWPFSLAAQRSKRCKSEQKPVEAYGSQTPTRASYPVYVLNEYVHCCTCMRFRAVLVHKQERIIC